MKVSAHKGFRFGIFLATLFAFLPEGKTQMSAYPMGEMPPTPPPPQNSVSTSAPSYAPPPRTSYPGMAPGMSAQATGRPKDLSGRFGLGVTNLGPKASPLLSVDWQTSRSASLEVNLGVDSLRDNNSFVVLSRFSRNMFLEENMHFFLYLGGGFSSGQEGGKTHSGLLVEAGSGARFFFTGIPNFGFHVRFGLFYKSAGNSRMITTGITGAHYYF